MFSRYLSFFIVFFLFFLSFRIQAKEVTGQETLAGLIISLAREGKTIRGVLDLLKNNIPPSEYKNTLRFLESKKIDMDKAYPKLVLKKNKIFAGNKFLIYVKSKNHLVIGSKKLNIKTEDLFSLDKKLSVLFGRNNNTSYLNRLLFPEAEAVVVAAIPLAPYIVVLGTSALRVFSLIGKKSPTVVKFAMANVGLGAGPVKVLASSVVGVKVFRMFKTKHDLDGSFTCSKDGDWIFRTLPNAEGVVDYTNQLWNPHDNATRKIFSPQEFYNEIRQYNVRLAGKLSDWLQDQSKKSIRCSVETLGKLQNFSEAPVEKPDIGFEDAMAFL